METILIVDDNARLRALLHEWLSPEFPDCRILEAASGEEALKRAGSVPISIAVMDIGLPGMNGIETARTLTARYPRLRVVMLSIHEEEQYRREAATAGAHAYVPKRQLQDMLLPSIREQLDAIKIAAPNADTKSGHEDEQGVLL
ncbi:MAG: response regulator transcription factor [Nitrospirota bacterium]